MYDYILLSHSLYISFLSYSRLAHGRKVNHNTPSTQLASSPVALSTDVYWKSPLSAAHRYHGAKHFFNRTLNRPQLDAGAAHIRVAEVGEMRRKEADWRDKYESVLKQIDRGTQQKEQQRAQQLNQASQPSLLSVPLVPLASQSAASGAAGMALNNARNSMIGVQNGSVGGGGGLALASSRPSGILSHSGSAQTTGQRTARPDVHSNVVASPVKQEVVPEANGQNDERPRSEKQQQQQQQQQDAPQPLAPVQSAVPSDPTDENELSHSHSQARRDSKREMEQDSGDEEIAIDHSQSDDHDTNEDVDDEHATAAAVVSDSPLPSNPDDDPAFVMHVHEQED